MFGFFDLLSFECNPFLNESLNSGGSTELLRINSLNVGSRNPSASPGRGTGCWGGGGGGGWNCGWPMIMGEVYPVIVGIILIAEFGLV